MAEPSISPSPQSISPQPFGIVLVTAPEKEVAEAIARTVVEMQLAACVTLFPVASIYTWQGDIHQDNEWQLVIKTNLAQFEVLEAKVRELHPYEVPEIIGLPIAVGSLPYMQWMAANIALGS